MNIIRLASPAGSCMASHYAISCGESCDSSSPPKHHYWPGDRNACVYMYMYAHSSKYMRHIRDHYKTSLPSSLPPSLALSLSLSFPPSLPHHSKSHISSLQSWSIISTVTCYRNNLPILVEFGPDDVVHQNVLVLRRGASKHTKPWPHTVKQLLVDLRRGRERGEGRRREIEGGEKE